MSKNTPEVEKDIKRVCKVQNYKDHFWKQNTKKEKLDTLQCNLRTYELVKFQPGKQNHYKYFETSTIHIL